MDKNRGIVIGNAVTVPVAEWIGRRIVAYEKKRKHFITGITEGWKKYKIRQRRSK